MTGNPQNMSALPWADGLYSIKRHGLNLANCDREPVHTPGCIQAHGALLVLRLADLGILQNFLQKVALEVRGITGLDRVMAYRFHADQHGEVYAENKRNDWPAWLGLHYPESDIPHPAREIFRRIWTRPLPDAAGALVGMLPLGNPDTGQALDMTHCALRGASMPTMSSR